MKNSIYIRYVYKLTINDSSTSCETRQCIRRLLHGTCTPRQSQHSGHHIDLQVRQGMSNIKIKVYSLYDVTYRHKTSHKSPNMKRLRFGLFTVFKILLIFTNIQSGILNSTCKCRDIKLISCRKVTCIQVGPYTNVTYKI